MEVKRVCLRERNGNGYIIDFIDSPDWKRKSSKMEIHFNNS